MIGRGKIQVTLTLNVDGIVDEGTAKHIECAVLRAIEDAPSLDDTSTKTLVVVGGIETKVLGVQVN